MAASNSETNMFSGGGTLNGNSARRGDLARLYGMPVEDSAGSGDRTGYLLPSRRTDSDCPQLSALLSARDVALVALKGTCVLILSNVWATHSGPLETFRPRSPEARLYRPKGEAGFFKIVL